MRYRLDNPESRAKPNIKKMERSLALDLLGLVSYVVALTGALGFMLGRVTKK